MQNSIKHMAAAVIAFTAYFSSTLLIGQFAGYEPSVLFSCIFSFFLSGTLAAICFIVAVRHKKNRRYFISLALVMVCNCFADVYMSLFVLILGGTAASSPLISEIAYFGAEAFLAALCARIWYEEIPKTAVNRRKITAVTIAAVLFVLAVGAVSFLGGGPVLSTDILYLIIDGAVLCYSLRFFTVSSAAKPFRPLMVIITIYAAYVILTTYILPLFDSILTELSYFLLLGPVTLLAMLLISFLMLAGERMPEKPEQNTAAEEGAAAEKGTVLSDAGGER